GRLTARASWSTSQASRTIRLHSLPANRETSRAATAPTSPRQTWRHHHPLKADALDAACSGTTKIVIDHLDLGPANCSHAIAHGVLQRAALPVVQNLVSRRLPNVEDRFRSK